MPFKMCGFIYSYFLSKPAMCWLQAGTCLMILVYTSVCMCVCPLPRVLITSDMIWCDTYIPYVIGKTSFVAFPCLNLYDTCHQ